VALPARVANMRARNDAEDPTMKDEVLCYGLGPRCAAVRDGDDLFIVLDGVRVAKCGLPGTPQAGAWVCRAARSPATSRSLSSGSADNEHGMRYTLAVLAARLEADRSAPSVQRCAVRLVADV
jgi:hypothetical protein